MSQKDFLELTPKEFYYALWDKEKYDGYVVKAIIRPICDTLRKQTHLLYNLQLPKNKKVRNEKQLMRFAWDVEVTKPTQSREQMKAVMKDIVKSFKYKKNRGKERTR